jgi:nitroreductase
MELTDAIRARHMVRSFDDQPLDTELVDALVADTLRAPSAGNTAGTAWLVLTEPTPRAQYWELTTTDEWRQRSRRWPGLSRAPVVALSLACPAAYLARYAEADKSGAGLDQAAAWPVPYWFGDAAFATMTLFLRAADEAIGTCFLGNFRGEAAVLAAFGVPDGWRLFGSVLLGHPDGHDHRSASLDRPRPTAAERLHRNRWRGTAR